MGYIIIDHMDFRKQHNLIVRNLINRAFIVDNPDIIHKQRLVAHITTAVTHNLVPIRTHQQRFWLRVEACSTTARPTTLIM